MNATVARVFLTAALALSVSGCGREADTTAQQNDSQPPASAPAPVATSAPAPVPEAPLPPATELQVGKVQSVMVSRPADAPTSILIHAAGSVVSPGWTGARLALIEDPNADARIRIFSFVATSPEMPEEDRAPQSIETEIRVDDIPPEVRTVRVVSATNAISAPIVQ